MLETRTQEIAATKSPQQTAMNLVHQSGGAVVPASKLMTLQVPREKGDLVTNFRYDHAEDAVSISRAMSPCDNNLDVHVGKAIRIVGVVLNMAEFESQEVKGEMVERVYASIVLDDGSIVGTTGKAVMGQLAFLVGSSAPGPISPPAEYEVRRHKSQPPKQDYYSLRRILPVKVMPKKGVNNAG